MATCRCQNLCQFKDRLINFFSYDSSSSEFRMVLVIVISSIKNHRGTGAPKNEKKSNFAMQNQYSLM